LLEEKEDGKGDEEEEEERRGWKNFCKAFLRSSCEWTTFSSVGRMTTITLPISKQHSRSCQKLGCRKNKSISSWCQKSAIVVMR